MIAHIVISHIDPNKGLMLDNDLRNDIRNQIDKSSDFILMINDKSGLARLDKSLFPEFKTIIYSTAKYVSGVRNDAIDYIKSTSYTHVSFIDGDDGLSPNYSSILNTQIHIEDFISFGGYWISRSKTDLNKLEFYNMLSDENIIHSIKYVNWLYLYNVDWLRKTGIKYPNIDHSFAEDEFFFTKLRMLRDYFKILVDADIYKYNHFNASISKQDKEVSNILSEYLNYDENIKPKIIRINSYNTNTR